MPVNKTDSPLAQKYGQKRVVMARNLVQASLGLKPGTEKDKDKIPWAIIGKIAQSQKKAGKTIKESDITEAKERYKKYGADPSMKRYFKQSKATYKKEETKEKTAKAKKRTISKKVSRETLRTRKK